MQKETTIRLFEARHIRSVWSEEDQKWYFSIVDVIEVLTGTDRPRKYWSDLKSKLQKEGSQLSEKIGQLKMASADGKMYATDVADTEQLLRLWLNFLPDKLLKASRQRAWAPTPRLVERAAGWLVTHAGNWNQKPGRVL